MMDKITQPTSAGITSTAPLALFDMPLTDSEKQFALEHKEADVHKTPIIPVPQDAPPCTFALPDLGGKPTRLYPYHQADGALVGYIGRWDNIDPVTGEKRKEIRPICYCDLPNGKRAWRSAGIPTPRPTYRLPDILARPEAPILICEGEKTAEAAQTLLPQYVATTPMHGAQSPHKTDFSFVQERKVIISTDYDEAGQNFGDAVYDLCNKAGALGVFHLPAELLGKRIPTVSGFDLNPETPTQGYDLADALAAGWTEQDVQRLIECIPMAPYVKTSELKDINGKLGSHFRLTRSGVEFASEKKDKDGNVTIDWVWVCSYLAITHQTRDTQGQNWGRVLALIDNDGKRKEYVLPMSYLAGDGVAYREELLSQGLRLSSNGKHYLHTYITSANPQDRATCVLKCGWHNEWFVTPDRVYGQKKGERIVLQQTLPAKARPIQGSVEAWQNGIGALCAGNSRLVVAICAALTGPLLEPLGEENFGFHVEGGSSIGKTTLLHAAASVWGSPIQSWRTTDNAAEGLARAANDGLLILDELSQVDGSAADAMAYMLGNGAGKARSRRDGVAKPPERFRLVFLSSGETGLAAKMQEGGKQQKAGQTVRFIEIPADAGKGYGVFDCLHGLEDGNRLSLHLKHLAACNTGAVANAFLNLLCSQKTAIAESITKARKMWLEAYLPADGDGQVKRVGNKFALVAAVGELAIRAGILPWPAGGIANGATLAAEYSKSAYGELGLTECMETLSQKITGVQRGNLSEAEALLVAQAVSLDAIYTALARRALMNIGEHIGAAETYLRLALKAQSQSRATLETLAAIKNPPMVIAKQANITTGPQQVNNARDTRAPAPVRAGKSENTPNKLLEKSHEQRMDTRAPQAASRPDQEMEAMDTINRPTHS